MTAFLVAIGFYPLGSLVVRYVQTPPAAGYGFGAPVVVAGLMLTPFSLASFAAARVARRLARRGSAELVVAGSCVLLIASLVLFGLARSSYWQIVLAMALDGFGVGCVYAVNPLQITGGVPAHETGSAISFYQLARTVAYAIGSALSATMLSLSIPPGQPYPTYVAYGAAAAVCTGGAGRGAAGQRAVRHTRRPGGSATAGGTGELVPAALVPAEVAAAGWVRLAGSDWRERLAGCGGLASGRRPAAKTSAVAIAARPSPRPVSPRPSVVVPDRLTGTPPSASDSTFSASVRRGASLGRSPMTWMATLPISNPAPVTRSAVARSKSVPAAPAHLASDVPKLAPRSPSPAADSSASHAACAATSPSLCPVSPRSPGQSRPAR